MATDDDESTSGKERKLPMFTGTRVWKVSHLGSDRHNKKCLSENENPAKAKYGPEKHSSIKKRHLDGNEKRLQAEVAKRKQERSRITAVQQALRNLDRVGPLMNKKIVFEDESDRKNGAKMEVLGEEPKSCQLFTDQDDDDQTEEDSSFHIREEFEGLRGQKLLSLQSSYSNDSRFKLDKRFLEEHSQPDLHTLNHNIKSNSPKSGDKKDKSGNKNKRSASSSFYYSVSDNLSSLFSSQGGPPQFSLLSNRSDNRDTKEEETNRLESDRLKHSKASVKARPSSKQSSYVPQSNPFKPNGWFFINPEDKRLAEECSFFCCQNTNEEIRRKWLENRPIVLEIFRKLRRDKGRSGKKRSKDKYKKGKKPGPFTRFP